ncbi:MAG: TerB family tellurite resistance protein [Proteobacteria bacterium]|nr:TerB family tellurite resistance protein [Pseudomonadota bacterium]
MLRSLKALFDEGLSRLKDPGADIDPMPLAVASLLLEVARADHIVDEPEQRAVLGAIARFCELDELDIDTLMTTAAEAVDASVSFYDFTRTVNERLSREQKVELLEMLWRVAQADGRADHYEEYYIRKLADLLYLSHSDFIRAKLRAAGEL